LVHNWLREAEKFFDPADFSIGAWQGTDDIIAYQGTAPKTYVIKESLLNVSKKNDFPKFVRSEEFLENFEILATFSDEAHIALRSLTSMRSGLYREITAHSPFNVLMSGTLFPLGPTKDGPGIIQNCFGMLGTADCRLPPEMQLAFEQLFGDRGEMSITKFRILVSQFYIRRDAKSGWFGRWIIPRDNQRPIPFVLVPKADEWSSAEVYKQNEESKSFQRLKRKMSRHVLGIMEKADKLRFLAWHPCFQDIDRRVRAGGKSVDKQKIYEDEISRSVRVHKPSGRLERLIGLIRFIVEVEKQKFIIVSDRLFLLTFALHVLSPEEAELTKGLPIDEAESRDTRGGEALGDTLIGRTTSGRCQRGKRGGLPWIGDDGSGRRNWSQHCRCQPHHLPRFSLSTNGRETSNWYGALLGY
jgi:hypothetical protein